jgi:hypothetical protein
VQHPPHGGQSREPAEVVRPGVPSHPRDHRPPGARPPSAGYDDHRGGRAAGDIPSRNSRPGSPTRTTGSTASSPSRSGTRARTRSRYAFVSDSEYCRAPSPPRRSTSSLRRRPRRAAAGARTHVPPQLPSRRRRGCARSRPHPPPRSDRAYAGPDPRRTSCATACSDPTGPIGGFGTPAPGPRSLALPPQSRKPGAEEDF